MSQLKSTATIDLEEQLRKFLDPHMAKKVAKIHTEIAKIMAQGQIRCRSCGSCTCLSEAMVTTFVQSGWPTCCGATMSYEGPTPILEKGIA